MLKQFGIYRELYYIAMPLEEVITLSVGLYLIENAFNFVVKRLSHLRRILAQYATHNKRSLVRKIGSHLTWIHAQRIYIILNDVSNDNVSYGRSSRQLQVSCKSEQESRNSLELEAKVKEMQQELLNIQSQVNKLLQEQEKRLLFVDDEIKENTVSSTTSVIPPPPPPMPLTPLVKMNLNATVVRIDTSDSKIKPANSIIEEMSKKRPKLRHVELTPGGRPIRPNRKLDDPSDILLAVLKKRFDAIHSP